MPKPKKGESKKKYINRAIPIFMEEGYGLKESIGRANGFYKYYSGKQKNGGKKRRK
jgi:hypothetical protein